MICDDTWWYNFLTVEAWFCQAPNLIMGWQKYNNIMKKTKRWEPHQVPKKLPGQTQQTTNFWSGRFFSEFARTNPPGFFWGLKRILLPEKPGKPGKFPPEPSSHRACNPCELAVQPSFYRWFVKSPPKFQVLPQPFRTIEINVC